MSLQVRALANQACLRLVVAELALVGPMIDNWLATTNEVCSYSRTVSRTS